MIISVEDVYFIVIINTFFVIIYSIYYIIFVIMEIKNDIFDILSFIYYSLLKYLFLNDVNHQSIVIICFLINGCITDPLKLFLF